MTKASKIIADARKAKFDVTIRDDLAAIIKGNGVIVIVSGNGTILRGDVRLDLATRLTAARARRLLNLAA